MTHYAVIGRIHYAVIGRIPFDDEDSIFFYETDDPGQLAGWFERDLFEESNRTDQEEVRKECGCEYAVFITHIVSSETELGYL